MKKSKNNLEFIVHPGTFEDGFTQSEVTTMDNCGELWNLKYNERLEPHGSFSWALTYGSWMHSALEEWYATRGKSWSIKIDHSLKHRMPIAYQADWDYYEKLAHSQMTVYTHRYRHEFDLYKVVGNEWVERVVSYEFEGIKFTGLIDLLLEDKKTGLLVLTDHKTAGTIDRVTLEGWDFRFQFMFYVWLINKAYPDLNVTRIMPNAIRKPRFKKKDSETMDGFMSRIEAQMLLEPDQYFFRMKVPMRKGALKRFENEILRPKLQRLQILKEGGVLAPVIARNKNTDHCTRYNKVCPMFNICKHGEENKHLYITRKAKHEELEVES